jgi:hypothetical protein
MYGYEAEPFLRSRQSHSCSRISQHVLEPEGSLLCSQEPFTVKNTELFVLFGLTYVTLAFSLTGCQFGDKGPW